MASLVRFRPLGQIEYKLGRAKVVSHTNVFAAETNRWETIHATCHSLRDVPDELSIYGIKDFALVERIDRETTSNHVTFLERASFAVRREVISDGAAVEVAE